MTEKKLFVTLVLATLLLVSGSIVVDLFNRGIISFRYADEYYFITDALWKIILPVGLLILFRELLLFRLAALFMWFSVEATGNLCDELFSEHPEISSPYEYGWAAAGIVIAVLEYKGIKIDQLFFYSLGHIWEKIVKLYLRIFNGKRDNESN